MITKMFSIRDHKGESYNPPFCKPTHGQAERDFRSAVNDPNTKTLFEYPEDFALYYVGDFDDVAGTIMPNPAPQKVCDAVALKEKDSRVLKAERELNKFIAQ